MTRRLTRWALRHPQGVIALVAAAVLALAYVFQYGLGYLPCELCYRQRWPYWALIVLAGLGAALRQDKRMLPLLAAVALVSAGLGLHHTGVERDWWPGPASCSAGALTGDVDAILNSVTTAPIVPCDQASWMVLGLSMASYNALVSLALAGFALWAWQSRRSK